MEQIEGAMGFNPIEHEFRPMTEHEHAMLQKLLEPPFPGRDEVFAQIPHARVRKLLDDGTLEFQITGGPTADVLRSMPVTVELIDTDGVLIEVLLNIVNGRLNLLEIVKFSDDPIQIPLLPDEWRPMLNIPEETGRVYGTPEDPGTHR